LSAAPAGVVPGDVPHADDFPWLQPLGARPLPDGTTEFRVWAPRPASVSLRLGGAEHPLTEEGRGVFSARAPAGEGADYSFVLDGQPLPDPCSRWQPGGLRGPSRVVDTESFPWSDAGWGGLALPELVVYELHVGTFSEAGTFEGVIPYLEGLRELGVTAIELMPVADFPGDRGWGYDGVYLSAAHRAYGGPHGLQRLVDAAHAAGLGVILDVVYNHVGASGQQALEAFGPYFTDKYATFWGDALNYDDADCDPVREWVLQSAAGWVRDFHLDGLRLDALHAIFDGSASSPSRA
jgi:maltooligosyltrehalose trehalohydrolase